MNLDSYLEQLKEGCLPEKDVRRVCEGIKSIFIEESNV